MTARTSTALIVIADDDAKIRELCRDVLQVAGYSVLLARNGAEALEYAPQADLLILDLSMTPISGVEVLVELRAREATRYLRIILLTGLDTPAVHAMAAGYDVAAVLIKPVRIRKLVEQVYAVLRRGHGEDAD